MGFFDKLKHAFQPVQHVVQQAGKEFNPEHVESIIEEGVKNAVGEIKEEIEKPILAKVPYHVKLGDSVEYVQLAQPDAMTLKLFAGVGVDLGVELEIEFGMAISFDNPVDKIETLKSMVENPPKKVHELCDHLWHLVPTDLSIEETAQAVVGESVTITWKGEEVMKRVVGFLTNKGLMEKSLQVKV